MKKKAKDTQTGGALKIVVPSHRRHDLLTTHKAVAIDAVCVAESQLPLYREHFPDLEYVTHPDDVRGLHAKREWMYRHFGNVFMFDDDVRAVVRRYFGSIRTLPIVVTPQEVRMTVQRLFDMAKDCNAYLFGLGVSANPMMYRPWQPFSFTGTITGGAYGVRAGSRLFWNARMASKEDHWISALNCHFHRIIVRDNRFYADTYEYMTRRGGLTGQRTVNSESADVDTLERVFGPQWFHKRTPDTGGQKRDSVKSPHAILFKPPF